MRFYLLESWNNRTQNRETIKKTIQFKWKWHSKWRPFAFYAIASFVLTFGISLQFYVWRRLIKNCCFCIFLFSQRFPRLLMLLRSIRNVFAFSFFLFLTFSSISQQKMTQTKVVKPLNKIFIYYFFIEISVSIMCIQLRLNCDCLNSTKNYFSFSFDKF